MIWVTAAFLSTSNSLTVMLWPLISSISWEKGNKTNNTDHHDSFNQSDQMDPTLSLSLSCVPAWGCVAKDVFHPPKSLTAPLILPGSTQYVRLAINLIIALTRVMTQTLPHHTAVTFRPEYSAALPRPVRLHIWYMTTRPDIFIFIFLQFTSRDESQDSTPSPLLHFLFCLKHEAELLLSSSCTHPELLLHSSWESSALLLSFF